MRDGQQRSKQKIKSKDQKQRSKAYHGKSTEKERTQNGMQMT
jgi:hypothetical protein